MPEFTVRSDNVDVEQIMRQIRARIREKRGVDYTEEEIRELANVKLEKFLDPKGVRSDLLQQYREVRESSASSANYRVRGHADLLVGTAARAILQTAAQPAPEAVLQPAAGDRIDSGSVAADRSSEKADRHFELIHNLVVETDEDGRSKCET